MKEIGIDISNNRTKSVFDFFKQGKLYNYVITVCDEASGEKCPLLHINIIKLSNKVNGPNEAKENA